MPAPLATPITTPITPLSPPPPSAPVDWAPGFEVLGERFSVPCSPTPVPAPYWVGHSVGALQSAGLAPAFAQAPDTLLQALSGNQVLDGSTPRASVYSGHQFGQWAGQLGDGRALLLGTTAQWLEIQLKGAGRTPFSRMGDGRAVLRSSIREFLASEAMHALGVPTTRALCLSGSALPVRRETTETAAVLTRSAPSFVRFGHFEHFAYQHPRDAQHSALRTLADYVIDQHYPDCRSSSRWGGNPYAALLAAVSERTAQLLAHWQALGFCHGVMNTDNMSILGLTLDYGPFQFMDAYDPAHICNHSDTQGRYAFGRQPAVAYWNLLCLGQALLPLIHEPDLALEAVDSYQTHYPAAYAQRMAAKLGGAQALPAHTALVDAVLALLAAQRVDYTLFWHHLGDWVRSGAQLDSPATQTLRSLCTDSLALDQWLLSFSEHLTHTQSASAADLMQKTNPKFVLRNYLAEQAISAAQQADYAPLAALQAVLEQPFDAHTAHDAWAQRPPDWAAHIAVSCSS